MAVVAANACKKEPELSEDAVEKIEKARQRVNAGEFLTEEEAGRRPGL